MTGLRTRRAAGLEYLELATTLLHRARLADPAGGIWEAADLQWWWRRDQHADPSAATFWMLDDVPVAAVIFTDWGETWGCDVIGTDLEAVAVAWAHVPGLVESRRGRPVDMEIRVDDRFSIEAAVDAGFQDSGARTVSTSMSASDRPAVAPLPDGFTLRSRADEPSRPHHMIKRNGEHVAERLAECSLYRPELDLVVYAPDGEVASYGLFWADPVTKIGLVEPMRTEDPYQGKGLAKHVLTTGLDRLARAGSEQLDVAYVEGNEPARRLYLGAGFTAASVERTYRRQA